MKILSIDVGIKNLALCILETKETSNFIIKYWEVISLCDDKKQQCEFNIVNKKGTHQCSKDAKYHKNNQYFCKSHCCKTEFKLPTQDLNKYKKLKLQELDNLINDHEIVVSGTKNKTNLIKHIENFIEKFVLETINSMKCNDYSLIDIGCSIKNKLDKLEPILFSNIDYILIENQISPIANRMNCIQGMISQYFIMKNMNNIKFISAANKLKPFIGNKKTTYSERKKTGVEITQKLLLMKDDNNIEMFNKHKKKDDLADCFLQGIWYFIENCNLKISL